MIDRIIGVAGLALAILAIIVPYRWPKVRRWITDIGLGLGCFLLGVAAWMYVASSSLDPTTAGLKEKLDDAQQEVALLKSALFPRGLSLYDYNSLKVALEQSKHSILFDFDPGCHDCAEYAKDLKNMFKDSGWAIGNGFLLRFEKDYGERRGLILICGDTADAPQIAGLVVNSFRAQNIDIHPVTDQEHSAGVCTLLVGPPEIAERGPPRLRLP